MDRIKYLLLLVLREEASPAEQAELEAWAGEDPANRELMQDLQDPAKVAEALATLDQLHRQEAWAKVERHALEAREKTLDSVESYAAEHRPVVKMEDDRSANRHPTRKLIFRWSVAAAVVLLVAGAALWLQETQNNPKPAVAIAAAPAHDVPPGGNKATLYLAGGQKIILDSASNGLLAEQGKTTIQKLKSGQIAYVPRAGEVGEVNYNTLTTPRGGQYQLQLPDGTNVWLNAESSITYPTAFTGAERKVSITGEAYFEVAKESAHPFIVRLPAVAKGNREDGSWMDVEVLGTSFDINAYNDEAAARTTLVEGSIKVSANGTHKIIEPGEQTTVTFGGPGIEVDQHADVARALAWKNGLFAFSNADLPTVMRQLSRWYDVDVQYEGNIPKDQFEFNGKIGKMLTLDQVLRVLTKTQVHYTIEGNKLTIKP